MFKVSDIVLGNPAQQGGFAVSDLAFGFVGVLGQARQDMGEITVVAGPEINQESPVHFPEVLELNQRVLIVSREHQAALQRGPHKTLMIVRRRIHQVSKNLFPRPLLWTGTSRCISIGQLRQQWLGLSNGSAQVGSYFAKGIIQCPTPSIFRLRVLWSSRP